MFFLVYVDDLLVIGNDDKLVSTFVTALAATFSVKELGTLDFFLGVEAIQTQGGLFLSQYQYIHKILERTNMLHAKDFTTLISSMQSLQLIDDTPTTDATKFRKVVGALQYMALTRPNVSYAVNKLAQFMNAPKVAHWSAAIRVLRYLKHTIDHGLLLKRNQPLRISAFTNADWARNKDNCLSTSAYVVYVGGNHVSWCSRK
ncbi:uncharacterized mitochondrial protein AtMg00810-like [Rutidosis leptorrhynchoides]|uniref:uncharacterized mitochondrial protein AtMg00810-like n=1 Tax=Rutidosis leptorrhynchoides TaxID=125765 RepID=UPI003A99E211